MSQPYPHRDEPRPDGGGLDGTEAEPVAGPGPAPAGVPTRGAHAAPDEPPAAAPEPPAVTSTPSAAAPADPAVVDTVSVDAAGGAHRTVQLPREAAAEVTTELPPVPPGARPADVPLLDLLAPREPGASPYVAPESEPYRPVAGDYQPMSGSGWDGGYADATTAAPPQAYGAYDQQPYPPAAYPPAGQHVAAPPRRPGVPRRAGPRRRPPGVGVVAVAAAGVLLLGAIAVWALTSGPPPDDDTPGGSPTPTSAPETSAVLVADGYQFTQAATRNDTDCLGNSYGKVSDFFRENPCTALDRALYTTTVDGRPAVVSVAVVRMPDQASASELRKLADTSGTGNVADLLRAGVTVPGGPASLSSAGYASELDGSMVVITEADFADKQIDDPETLDRLSAAALQLRP